MIKNEYVAQRLRNVVAGHLGDPDGIPNEELLCVLDLRIGSSNDFADPGDVLRLAELIDRPTTKLSVDEDGRTCCASCGCACLYMGSATYCPDCGAEVGDE